MSGETYPPKGKKVKKTLRGGPWAKEVFEVRELDDGTTWPSQILVHRGQSYVGRYVPRAIQQKTRVIKVLEWEGAEDEARVSRIRRAIVSGLLTA